ncbi:MAG: hypothetical protein JWQ09_3464 [Segetibacter sp.]|nr:hypothetical protein [Segetibacter sp.]
MKTYLFIICLLVSGTSLSQQRPDVYFLSVGSGHYEQDARKFREKGFIPYDNLPEATTSASIMSQILVRFADAKGKTLLSNEDKPLAKAKILASLDSVKSQIERNKAKNPFFVLYYCGHGISENLAWNQFLIPGNYTYIPGNKNVDHLNKYLIWIGDLVDKLEKLKVPYMLLIDCCRKEEADKSFPEKRMRYFFSEQNVETFKSLVSVLKFMNEFHQTSPVVFSITPGEVAPVVDIPKKDIVAQWGLDSSMQIGPLCRRVLKMVDTLNQHSQISLERFVRLLTDVAFDDKSPTAVSFYQPEEDKRRNNPLLKLRQ